MSAEHLSMIQELLAKACKYSRLHCATSVFKRDCQLFIARHNSSHCLHATCSWCVLIIVNNQHDIKRRGEDFDTKFLFERVHSKEVGRRIFLRNLTKRGFNKLFKKLRDTGTVNRRPGMADRTVPALKKTLSFFRSSRSLPLTFFCRLSGEWWSDQEHLFENKVSGILRELLKQKLSALHVSSAVRVCQLLCTAPLETFQMQVLTNNLGCGRPMNTRLPW